ncbi:MAG TPA: alpha-2-macroglobulin family protein [Kofleriaceae bacterium]
MKIHETILLATLSLACRDKSGDRAPATGKEDQAVSANTVANEPAPAGPADRSRELKQAQKGLDVGAMAGSAEGDVSSGFDDKNVYGGKMDEKKPDATKTRPGSESATRTWFPETFLFEPLVVTDANGAAVVPVRVPDRLTTWRVLALAHSRTGAQGGATTSFLGTLPAYVDPVVPPFLMAGDEIRLPIQLVNTTAAPVATSLALGAVNAKLGGAGGKRTIPAQGSLVEYATLTAERAGAIKVTASLEGSDAIERVIEVQPTGKPISVIRSGTLAAPRALSIDGPAGSNPATDRVRLLVFPGALALLRSELAISTTRQGVADDAYALLLAGRAPALLASLGDKPEPETLRTLTIVGTQRSVRHARTLDVTSATLLTEAALAHTENPVLQRLGERAAAHLAGGQRPDGTFSGATGWTLQRVLVATADATRAVNSATTTPAAKQRALAVTARASGAFARTLDQVQDGYTAAAILASGGVKGEVADKLRTRVREAIKDGVDGAKYLEIGEGVVRADGTIPSHAEATALAILALTRDTPTSGQIVIDPKVADLGTYLLGSYLPAWGWGDGRTNLAAMQAVLQLFKTPLPRSVTITLAMDGKPIASGQFDSAKLRDVLVLEGPAAGFSGTHAWTLSAEPAVPGLGYSLALQGYVPWQKQPVQAGLELALPATVSGSVGKPIDLTLTAIAPSGIALHVQQALPAGVQVDRPSLEALIEAGKITRFVVADGKVSLHVAPLAPGATFTAKYRVIPTLAGKLQSAASLIEAGATKYFVPPTMWTVR